MMASTVRITVSRTDGYRIEYADDGAKVSLDRENPDSIVGFIARMAIDSVRGIGAGEKLEITIVKHVKTQ